MTNYVVSVDFSTGNKEIVKELAIVRVTDSDVSCLFVGTFLPPTGVFIPRFKSQAVAYQERRIHGVKWTDGKFQSFQVTPILKAFLPAGSIVVGYGDQVTNFLYEELDQGVFNLQQEWDVPRWSDLPPLEETEPCAYAHSVGTTCTAKKALKYAHWLKTHGLVSQREFLP